MKFFLAGVFALVALASSVFANPEPAPGGRVVIIEQRCQGRTSGTCPSGQLCQQSRDRTYSCVTPQPQGSRRPSVKRSAFCDEGAVACPVVGQLHGFECVQIKTDLEQCGDCAVLGGVDCTALPGVENVACVNGYCRVESCTKGFVFDFRKRTCVSTAFWNVQPEA
ncbi:hypothetical protein JCM3766R1_006886 [Sporobolomyces carnicolor]